MFLPVPSNKPVGSASRPTIEEADVDVASEYVDVRERHVGDTSDGAAVVQELANVGAALAHPREPPLRYRTELDGPLA
jgi:hypothetical protein